MKILEKMFDSKKSQKTNSSKDLMYILIVLFLLIISVIVFYCIRLKKDKNEGYQNKGDVFDILSNKNTKFSNNNPRCKFSTYLFNQNNIGEKEKMRTLEFYNSNNTFNFGDVIDISNSITVEDNNDKYIYLKKNVEISKINNKLDISYMSTQEQEKIKLQDDDQIREIVINDEIEKSLKIANGFNKTFNILKGLQILSNSDSHRFYYDFDKILRFFDINLLEFNKNIKLDKLNNQEEIIDLKTYNLYNMNDKLIQEKKNLDKKVNKTDSQKIKLKYVKELLKIIENKNETNLDLPLKIIQLKSQDDNYFCLGDIIYCDIHNQPLELENINNQLMYRKIPKRCLKKIGEYGEEHLKYQLINNDGNIINIYQHPEYKTFKAYSENEFNSMDQKPSIYLITPCVNKITIYQDKINSYNTLKMKCQGRTNKKEIDTRMSKADKFFELEAQKMIAVNKNNIKNMRKKLQNLKQQINTNDNIRHNYNRHKLQEINNINTENLNLGMERLHDSLNTYDLNLEFQNLQETKEKLERLKRLRDNRGILGNDNMEDIQLSIDDLKSKCGLEGYIRKDIVNSCHSS